MKRLNQMKVPFYGQVVLYVGYAALGVSAAYLLTLLTWFCGRCWSDVYASGRVSYLDSVGILITAVALYLAVLSLKEVKK